ncbi:hypothetical protein L596_006239 [Steinernema carpocapsae]|uniref:Uncharacterized protein n=1 Tax=Steinernema carpocapsae TaxID=34508 RepID=A0A4U8V973_STECR|nr:hypothetical protein L596_006239 [Steinernema carpocapsae]
MKTALIFLLLTVTLVAGFSVSNKKSVLGECSECNPCKPPGHHFNCYWCCLRNPVLNVLKPVEKTSALDGVN